MPEKNKILAGDLAMLAGMATLFIFRAPGWLWLLPGALCLLVLRLRLKGTYSRSWQRCFLPIAAGLLAWPLRLFYWDRGDFDARVSNLMLLASFFTLYLLARQRRWPVSRSKISDGMGCRYSHSACRIVPSFPSCTSRFHSQTKNQ